MVHRNRLLAAVLLGAMCAIAPPTSAASQTDQPHAVQPGAYPPGFAEKIIATGLHGVTAMAVTPDGRVLICEQRGTVRLVRNGRLLPDPILTLHVENYWERGLIGITLDPRFSSNGHVYLCYVADRPYTHHVVSRFTMTGDAIDPASEKILLEGDDQAKLGGSVPAGHQGGVLRFGPDGKLYISIGEQTAGEPSQRLDTFQGKILRIDPDGSIPADNPLLDRTAGKYRAIYAYGLRNTFGMAFEKATGRLLGCDVGGSRWEEINRIVPGGNYGWPLAEGLSARADLINPIHAYGEGGQKSIIAGLFYEPEAPQFPPEYHGRFFFADYAQGWIRTIDPDSPVDVRGFATGLLRPVDLQLAPDGSLYLLQRNAWVHTGEHRSDSGSLHRIFYIPSAGRPAPRPAALPEERVTVPGRAVTLRVEASGAEPMSFRWQRDGRDVPGADGPELRIEAAEEDDGAEYRCIVSNEHGMTRTNAMMLRVVRPRPAATIGAVASGVRYRYYGELDADSVRTADLDALEPMRAGHADGLELPAEAGPEPFAVRFDGYLRVPAEDAYTFTLSASGPAKLFIGGMQVAVTVGSAEMQGAQGVVGLAAGPHPMTLHFRHTGGEPELRLTVRGSEGGDRPVGGEMLLRPAAQAAATLTVEPGGGAYSGPVWARLRAEPEDAVIRYTLDGTAPTADSPRYERPVRIDRSLMLAARAFAPGAAGAEGDASQIVRARFEITGDRPYGLRFRRPATTLNIPMDPRDLPRRLSETGLVRSMADLSPSAGVVVYEVNTPQWVDGARLRRWIALPGDARIGFSETEPWRLPAGTVLVQHVELGDEDEAPAPDSDRGAEAARRVETRLLVVNGAGGTGGAGGGGYGVTYRWREDQSDADLLDPGATGLTERITYETGSGTRSRDWYYPGREDCRMCHTAHAGFALGLNTRQLNRTRRYQRSGVRDNQLRAWSHAGLFERSAFGGDEGRIGSLPRLAAVDDEAASLRHRARSYLDVNCSSCHRPGGIWGMFDARYHTPLERQGLIDGQPRSANLGVEGARYIAPGRPGRSLVWLRMNRRGDVFSMPPLATRRVDEEAVRLMGRWIESLGGGAESQR